MRDWEGLRRACEGGESLEALSRRLDIPYSTLLNRAVKEDWKTGRDDDPGAVEAELERVAGKLVRWIEQQLDGGGLEPKDVKNMTGALKELQSLREEKSETRGEGLTVRFLGDAEEMSR